MNIKLFRILPLLVLPLLFTACGDDEDDVSQDPKEQTTSKNKNANPVTYPEYARLEVPRVKGGTNLVLIHYATDIGVNYMVEWDCLKKSQRWTCYTLNNTNSTKNVSRYYSDSNQYPQDPDIPSNYRFASDPYWRSGYDHGHICPSYDRLCSSEANYQTFYMSNMQPQFNKFNAGLWLKMENIVSGNWNRSSFRDTLYVCKGGTIDDPELILSTTDKGMIVPKYFFMAVLCKNTQGYKAIAFWAQHLNSDHSNDNLIDYVISIDELENRTGIDFFCNLPDDIEEKAERVVYPQSWGLK
ncbi:MAG: DNA/RNA non-specific endonuclease [Prevotella sp.]|nr:DNA/RNA non-specific endonuclease [Prevotella sp.]